MVYEGRLQLAVMAFLMCVAAWSVCVWVDGHWTGARAFSTQQYTCNPDAYGADASQSADAISDIYCTVRNLVTGRGGKMAAIALIAFGFVRAIQGNSMMSAAIPFLIAIGLAQSEGLADLAGYTFS